MNPRAKTRFRMLLAAGAALVGAVLVFRQPLLEQIRNRATLANDAPTPEGVAEMIVRSSNPPAALLAAWHSGKVVHREAALREIGVLFTRTQPLPTAIEEVLEEGALDPDMDVREMALSALQERHEPALMAMATAQFDDPDAEARVLGLRHLADLPAKTGVPLIAGLLEDPDLRVTSECVKLLERWSGEAFGIRLADAALMADPQTGLPEFSSASQAKVQGAVDRAKAWWSAHQLEFPAERQSMKAARQSARPALRAADFQLRTIGGESVRLSDFRGKVVLINFWATWCTACVAEMPELVALQKAHRDQVVILGICLDLLPDDDGDPPPDPAVVRQKLARVIRERGLNYKMLLDEHNDAGGSYNGGELPTTVIVDAQGYLRRRFVGARRLREFEDMISEAGTPIELTNGLRQADGGRPPAL